MTDVGLSNSLADLVARIRAEHEATAAALKSSVEHAMTAGDLLIEAKAQLKHGEWLPWLAEHCEMSERTAQLYMRLACERPMIESKAQHVADLNLRGAVALMSPVKRDSLESQMMDLAANAADCGLQWGEWEGASEASASETAFKNEATTAIHRIRKLVDVHQERGAEAFQYAWEDLQDQWAAAWNEHRRALGLPANYPQEITERDMIAAAQQLVERTKAAAAAAAFEKIRNIAFEMLRRVESATEATPQ
jgi:hypothetical protein